MTEPHHTPPQSRPVDPSTLPDKALLHEVTGSARLCGPCAWSALTGMSSDSWPDAPTRVDAPAYEFDRLRFKAGAPWYVDPLPKELIGTPLSTFREPGRWSLCIESDDYGTHAVALGVRGTERVIADNHIRTPMALESAMNRQVHTPESACYQEVYRTAVVVSGIRLVPDQPVTPVYR